MQENYLESIKKQFAYYKLLGEKTFAQLDDAALFWQYNPESNSIAIIVNHLWGNMRSRWTDFLFRQVFSPSEVRKSVHLERIFPHK